MKVTRYARLEARSLAARARGKRLAHFLHIRKTAGTAIKHALLDAPPPPRYVLALHTHGVRLEDVPRGDPFFFVVRDPVDRFASGFASRLRQGKPRYFVPWTPGEAAAFARFSTPAELGLALAASGDDRASAEQAMHDIAHVRSSYWDWFGNEAALRRRAAHILFIGFQEELDAQMPELAAALGLPEIVLPRDEVAAHRTPGGVDRSLPQAAREALAEWYRRDYEFLALCRELRDHRS